MKLLSDKLTVSGDFICGNVRDLYDGDTIVAAIRKLEAEVARLQEENRFIEANLDTLCTAAVYYKQKECEALEKKLTLLNTNLQDVQENRDYWKQNYHDLEKIYSADLCRLENDLSAAKSQLEVSCQTAAESGFELGRQEREKLQADLQRAKREKLEWMSKAAISFKEKAARWFP